MIELKNIRYTINNHIILDNINFNIHKGDNIAIIGPNGAGKTTLLNLILNIPILNYKTKTHKLEGKIHNTLFDVNHYDDVKICLQNSNFSYNLYLKVKELLNLCFHNKLPIELLKEFGLEKKLDCLVRTLSGGEYQKLNIILTIASNPKVIFLDEITTGLDYESKKKIIEYIKNYIRKNDVTVVFVSHYLEEISEIANKVCFINKGKIVESGDLADLYKKYQIDQNICQLYEEVILSEKNL